MKIQVDKTKKIPLYKQIVEQIQAQITSGEIPDGFQFPSERQLADALGVNRTTVLNAYKELKADGLMASHVGRGTVAVSTAGEYPVKTIYQKEPIWEFLYSDYLKNHEPFDVNKYLEIANQKDVISFAAGIASFENLPTQAFEGIEAELLSRQKELLVSPVAGFFSLRKVISTYMQKRSCFCQPSEIMVLSGSQQGIDLITRAFINPGDLILIEEPSFFPAIQSFRAAGAKIMAVPMENDGMDMEILEQLLSRYRPKFLYTMPAYHNPTGICMSLAKRIRLLELVNKYGIPVLEDDPYGELYFEGQPLSPLKSMDKNGYVMYLSTFSKTISPGLRLGWICTGKKLIHQLCNIRQLADLHSNCISQQVVERFIVSGGMADYLTLIRREYKERRDIMAEALDRYAPPGLSWNIPTGGYYLWCTLPEGVSAEALAQKAAAGGVAILPGMPSYLVTRKGEAHVRLNYTFPAKNRISEGIRLLCEAIRELLRLSKEAAWPAENEINPIL